MYCIVAFNSTNLLRTLSKTKSNVSYLNSRMNDFPTTKSVSKPPETLNLIYLVLNLVSLICRPFVRCVIVNHVCYQFVTLKVLS